MPGLKQCSDELSRFAVDHLLRSQQRDLIDFRVEFDSFALESKLHESGKVNETLGLLQKAEAVFEEEGALFFLQH